MQARSNPYDGRADCAGVEVLRVQNTLPESVEIVRLLRGQRDHTAHPVSIALLSPGAHTLKVPSESDRYFAARKAGGTGYISTTQNGMQMQNPAVRLEVQCRPTA